MTEQGMDDRHGLQSGLKSLGSLGVVLGAYALRSRFAPRRPPTGRFTDRTPARTSTPAG